MNRNVDRILKIASKTEIDYILIDLGIEFHNDSVAFGVSLHEDDEANGIQEVAVKTTENSTGLLKVYHGLGSAEKRYEAYRLLVNDAELSKGDVYIRSASFDEYDNFPFFHIQSGLYLGENFTRFVKYLTRTSYYTGSCNHFVGIPSDFFIFDETVLLHGNTIRYVKHGTNMMFEVEKNDLPLYSPLAFIIKVPYILERLVDEFNPEEIGFYVGKNDRKDWNAAFFFKSGKDLVYCESKDVEMVDEKDLETRLQMLRDYFHRPPFVIPDSDIGEVDALKRSGALNKWEAEDVDAFIKAVGENAEIGVANDEHIGSVKLFTSLKDVSASCRFLKQREITRVMESFFG